MIIGSDGQRDVQMRIRNLVGGNIGALRVLTEMIFELEHEPDQVLPTLEENGIQGPGIWVLYKDHCGCDMGKFVDMMLRPPANIKELSQERV